MVRKRVKEGYELRDTTILDERAVYIAHIATKETIDCVDRTYIKLPDDKKLDKINKMCNLLYTQTFISVQKILRTAYEH